MTSLFKVGGKCDTITFLAKIGKEMFDNGIPEYEVREELTRICLDENPYRTEQSSKRYVNGAIKYIKSGMKISYDPISFSIEELDYIRSICNPVIEREMFVLFCLYKCKGDSFDFKETAFIKECKIKRNEYDVSSIITTNSNDNAFYCPLNKGVGSVFCSDYIKSLYNENNIVFTIENYDDVVYHYEMYLYPDRYFKCQKCKKIVKKKSNNQKYCKECSQEIKNEQNKKYDYYKNRNVGK